MNHVLRAIVILAAAQIGVVTSSNAQATWVFNGAGSSALYLEGGEAAAAQLQTVAGTGGTLGDTYQCVWTSSAAVVATDPTTTQTESGQSWVAWSIDTATGGTDCLNAGTNPQVYTYEQTDSVVGNRLLFNSATEVASSASVAAQTKPLIYVANACQAGGWDSSANPNTPVETCNLPSSIQTLLQSPFQINVAGTDIRPEDALFATDRALTPCGTAIPFTLGQTTTSQYLGLGYTSGGTAISSYYSSGTFHVTSFSLPSGYQVFRFGAAPIVVHVNQTNASGAPSVGAAGFGDAGITNIPSGVLANFLDGTLSRTQDIPGATGTSQGVTVLIREPLSGTYNTMEYNVPNTLENQTSSDVGQVQQATQRACATTANPMHIATKAGIRARVVGTGEMEKVMFGQELPGANTFFPAVLGWSFWSQPNFQNAYAGSGGYQFDARYLMVDGVDPLQNSYTGGTIPTVGNGLLTNVTLAHVIDGTYPIWSFLRLVCTGANPTACTTASNLVQTAQNYVALGSFASALHPPDFVPVNNNSQGVASATYSSGGSLSGTGNVTLSLFNVGCDGTTATLAVSGGTAGAITINSPGTTCLSAPTTATCTSGTASCSGTVTLTSTLKNVGSVWNSLVIRSHFVPPGIGAPCTPTANGTGPTTGIHAAPECGGDVGGVVYTLVADHDYETDFQSSGATKETGITNRRR